ncbi:MAG TPA: regulator [Rhodospirillaceae bacterium]|uniref:type II toxin-antitoxin system PrlF family antitoxin n=1 Tax=Hwanghaeella sp. LZ110 TaxID=3402810 RepID=UPI000C56BDA3|nr:regulator [Rhodospirillaceae bacterium]MAX63589.1 regulator [Rhodospirillaceae bacterium]MBB56339.1 regulator [Rhodospirillaceae bacterium]HAE01102.1 regulator [Rhodospirillaceae bacterium]HAJ20301.1 regulator [Rhodospirillaceae bacterium]
MVALSNDISKLTARYQTTVPSGVRKQLKLQKGDQIRYCTDPNGRVYIEPVREAGDDPALGAFLDFLEADIHANPARLQAFSGRLYDRLNGLVGGVDVNIDDSLSPDDE